MRHVQWGDPPWSKLVAWLSEVEGGKRAVKHRSLYSYPYCEKTSTARYAFYLPPVFAKQQKVLFLGSVAVSADVSPYISVAIKANFFKFAMCNICKNNIAKMFLDFFFKFKIVHLREIFFIFGKKSSARRISKTAGWIFTKFAMQVHLSF